jgi:hypothetical protein
LRALHQSDLARRKEEDEVTAALAADTLAAEDALLGIAGDYMDSLTANDPSGAPFAAQVRSTENGVETPLTDGLWRTARGWLYRHTFVDAVSGEIGAFGSIRETGQKDAMIALRLKTVGGKITESELLVTREGDFALFAPRFATNPREIYSRVVPENRRISRAALADIPRKFRANTSRQSRRAIRVSCRRIPIRTASRMASRRRIVRCSRRPAKTSS